MLSGHVEDLIYGTTDNKHYEHVISAGTKIQYLMAEWNDISAHIEKEGYANSTDAIKKAGLYFDNESNER